MVTSYTITQWFFNIFCNYNRYISTSVICIYPVYNNRFSLKRKVF